LSSKHARRKARAKIDRPVAVLNEFRKHMIKELELIDNVEKANASHHKLEHLAAKLRAVRKYLGLSQSQLAARIQCFDVEYGRISE
jgi:uncharacterized coiled-coil DUF342 family protein